MYEHNKSSRNLGCPQETFQSYFFVIMKNVMLFSMFDWLSSPHIGTGWETKPSAPSIGAGGKFKPFKPKFSKTITLVPTSNRNKEKNQLSPLTPVLIRIWPDHFSLGNHFTIYSLSNKLYITSISAFVSFFLIFIHSCGEVCVHVGWGVLSDVEQRMPGPQRQHLHYMLYFITLS